MEALRGEESVAGICPGHGIGELIFYKWSKELMEAVRKRLAGDTTHEAISNEGTNPEKRKSATQVDVDRPNAGLRHHNSGLDHFTRAFGTM